MAEYARAIPPYPLHTEIASQVLAMTGFLFSVMVKMLYPPSIFGMKKTSAPGLTGWR